MSKKKVRFSLITNDSYFEVMNHLSSYGLRSSHWGHKMEKKTKHPCRGRTQYTYTMQKGRNVCCQSSYKEVEMTVNRCFPSSLSTLEGHVQ